jgi:hypothetical protein
VRGVCIEGQELVELRDDVAAVAAAGGQSRLQKGGKDGDIKKGLREIPSVCEGVQEGKQPAVKPLR